MTARFARDEMSFVIPTTLSYASSERDTRTAASSSGFAARFAAIVRWLADMPRRQAVIEELSALSDHELSDIGLTRGDLSRVFDRQFTAERGLRPSA